MPFGGHTAIAAMHLAQRHEATGRGGVIAGDVLQCSATTRRRAARACAAAYASSTTGRRSKQARRRASAQALQSCRAATWHARDAGRDRPGGALRCRACAAANGGDKARVYFFLLTD